MLTIKTFLILFYLLWFYPFILYSLRWLYEWPFLIVLISLYLYISLLNTILLVFELDLLLLIHSFLVLYFSLYFIEFFLFVPNPLLKLLLIWSNILIFQLELLNPLLDQLPIRRLLSSTDLLILKQHIRFGMWSPKFFLEFIIVNLIDRLILYGDLVEGRVESRLDSYLIILYIWLHWVILVLYLMLDSLVLELDGWLDPLLSHLRLHLNLFVLLRNYTELIRLVSHWYICWYALIAQCALLLHSEASLSSTHGHTLILHISWVLQGGIFLLIAILHRHIDGMAACFLYRDIVSFIVGVLLDWEINVVSKAVIVLDWFIDLVGLDLSWDVDSSIEVALNWLIYFLE